MITCLAVLFRHAQNDVNRLTRELKDQIFDKWIDSVKLTVPAILYTVQNNLLFLALSCLDAATYQVNVSSRLRIRRIFSSACLLLDYQHTTNSFNLYIYCVPWLLLVTAM